MECDICTEDITTQDECYCTSCTRSLVYLSRLDLARTLLENEQLTKQVSDLVDDNAETAAKDPNLKHAKQILQDETLNAEKIAVKGRIEETRTHVTTLKKGIEQLKQEIQQQKERVAARKATLDTINQKIPTRQQASLDALSEVRAKGLTSFATISSKSTNNRAFLCREAATLLRLRQRKRQKNGVIAEQYTITALVLPDLKDINNVRCADLTAALSSAAHLLVLVAFYLGIRLPAEITMPHRDYPLPTINTPAQSYLGQKIAFPGSGSIGNTPSSPFSSKHDVKGPYRPRPLFIGSDDSDEKVAQFAKKDATAFSFFIEGISLLAWNIAWLSRTQGFSQGTNSWEDVCDIGRNLHQLILGSPQSPALLRVLSSRDAQRRQKQSSGSSTPAHEGNVLSLAKLGQASHLSANSFLGQASFNEQFRSWKFSKYNTIADSLKKLLVTEMNNAEWELLQEQEWDDGGEQFDEAVFIKARATDGRDFDEARSIMTTKPDVEENAHQSSNDRDQGKPKGTSGWTKVKSRNDG